MRHSANLLGWVVLSLVLAVVTPARSEEYLLALGAGITAKLTELPFIPADHQIEWCVDAPRTPCLIDGLQPIGNFIFVPHTIFAGMEVRTPTESVDCDTSGIYDAFIARIAKHDLRHLRAAHLEEQGVRVFGVLSAEVSSFAVEWRIVEGDCVRTMLDADEAVVNEMFEALRR